MGILREFSNGYRINSDESNNLILEKKITRKKKIDNSEYEDWDVVGYHSNIYGLLKDMVNHSILITPKEADFIPNLQRIEKVLIDIASDTKWLAQLKPPVRDFKVIEEKLTAEPPKKKKAARSKTKKKPWD